MNNKKKIYDVAVIGLGPAGATFARLLGDAYSTVLVDMKKSGDNSYNKPCGGLLSPDAQKALSKFKLTLPKELLVDPQIFSVKTIDLETNIVRNYQRFYMNLDRHKFDLWLKELIGSKKRIINGRCVDIDRTEKDNKILYKLKIKSNNEIYIIYTKYLIGADGANSIVRKYIYPNDKTETYLAIQQWFSNDNISPFYSCIFDKKTSDCVSWSISKDNYMIYGGAFKSTNSRKSFEAQKLRLKKCGFSLGKPIFTEACKVFRPKRFKDFLCGRDNAFLIGEAGAFISRSSLEGISFAINSGYILSEVFNNENNKKYNLNKKYKKKTLMLRIKLYLKILKSIFMYNPILRKLIMKSGIKTISIHSGR